MFLRSRCRVVLLSCGQWSCCLVVLQENGFAGLEDLSGGDAGEAFVFALDAFDEAAAFAVDGGAQHAMPGAVGMPAAGPVAGGKDGDASGADRGGEVHGAGVVAEVEPAMLESHGGRPEREPAGGIEAAAPGGQEALGVGGIFDATEDDGPDVEAVDEGLADLDKAAEGPALGGHCRAGGEGDERKS